MFGKSYLTLEMTADPRGISPGYSNNRDSPGLNVADPELQGWYVRSKRHPTQRFVSAVKVPGPSTRPTQS